MKAFIGVAGLAIVLLVAWLALKNQTTAHISPSGRFLVETCVQPDCEAGATVTVLTAPHKGFKASCVLDDDAAAKLAAAKRPRWQQKEAVLQFADTELDLRHDCGAPERLVSPSGKKTFVIRLNCLFSLDEQQVCRRTLSLEKTSKDGRQPLSFDCDYPLNQFDWQRISAGELEWNTAEDDLNWPLREDSQFARASGDDAAKLSIQMMCGNEAVLR